MDIYVGNLPYQADDQKLQELFEQHGSVTSARVIVDKFTGDSKGFGFVEMPDRSEAMAAISATNEQDFMGRSLRVNESQPKPRTGGGGRDGGNRGGGRDSGGGRDRRW
ncbi:MAG: RNA-binding protein [Spartobacteria bacterium]|nr:RNA-binding protein [Spartobacteria bacterium]